MAEEYKYIPSFSKGLNKNKRGDLIDDLEVNNILNLHIFEGSLSIAKGYSLMDIDLPDGTAATGAYEEIGKRLYKFDIADGTKILLFFTNAAVYTYDSGWDLTTRDTTDTFTAVAGTDVCSSGSAHTLSDNDTVKLTTTGTLPAGLATNLVYYIIDSSTPDFKLSLTAGGSAIDITDTGTGVHSFTPGYEGSDAHTIKAVTYTPLDAVIWTNAVDVPQIYINEGSGYQCRDLGGLDDVAGSISTITACRELAIWNEKLYMFYTTEDAADVPQMIRWSDTANIEEWNNDGSNDGGFNRLSDRDDKILAAKTLGSDLIVYRDNSIVKGQWIGSTTRTAKWEEMISEEGLIGPNAVTSVGDSHIFFGANNIYDYKGGSTLTRIGTQVRKFIFSPEGILSVDRDVSISLQHIKALKEVWCILLVGTTIDSSGDYTAYKSTTLIYNTIDRNWTIREFGSASVDIQINYAIEANLEANLAWNDTEQTWADFGDTRWNTQAFAAGFPNILMCSKQDILDYDHVEALDNDVAIPFSVETKDFSSGANYVRLHFVDLTTVGPGCTISYSLDEGVSWSTLGTVASSVNLLKSKLFLNITSQLVRFRISGSGAGFKLGSFGFKFSIDSEY